MKKIVDIHVKEEFLKVMSGITFSQVPDYFGEMQRDLKLDLIVPLNRDLPPRPLIIWIIGGAWMAVNKTKFISELTPFAKAGYAVASVEYRVSGEEIFPAQIIDVKSAIRYLRAHADTFGLDPERFYVMGESAGGHLASLAAAASSMPEWEQGWHTDTSSAVQGCVDLYGVIDFLNNPLYPVPEMFHDLKSEEILIGGKLENHKEEAVKLNPLTYVSEKTPPFLIFHGLEDNVVPYHQSEYLYDGLKERGIPAKLYLVNGAGHADPRFYQEETRSIILDFLNSLQI